MTVRRWISHLRQIRMSKKHEKTNGTQVGYEPYGLLAARHRRLWSVRLTRDLNHGSRFRLDFKRSTYDVPGTIVLVAVTNF